MHPYKIVAQISLIFSILNLVLTAPIVVQEIPEARGDEMVVAEDVPALSKKSDELEAASDTPTSPPPFPGAMASPQHSPLSDGSTSSGYPVPHLLSDSSDSGYSWLLDRPPRLSPNLPASLHELASPRPSSSGLSEIQLPEWMQGLAPEMPPYSHLPEWLHESSASIHPSSPGSSEIALPEWLQGLAPEMPPSPHLPALLQGFPSPHASSSGSETPLPEWWQWVAPAPDIPPSPQLTGSDRATTETYSPSDRFTPSHHPLLSSSMDSVSWHADESMFTPYSLASGGSLSSHYFSASDGLAPSHSSISESEGSPSPPSPGPPPTEKPPENAKFLTEDMMKKLKIVAGVVVIGGAIAGIAGSQIKHRDFQDS
jgi:hypothetical protein